MTAVTRKPVFTFQWTFASGHTCVLRHNGRDPLASVMAVQDWLDAGWCTADEAWRVANYVEWFNECVATARAVANLLGVKL